MFGEHLLRVRRCAPCFANASPRGTQRGKGIFVPVHFVSHWDWGVEIPPRGGAWAYMGSKAPGVLGQWALFK